ASDSPQLETTYRFRLRGAALLPPELGTVAERMAIMNRLYRFRSQTVHASKTVHGAGKRESSEREALRKTCLEADSVLRAILRWFVRRSERREELAALPQALDIALVEGGEKWATD